MLLVISFIRFPDQFTSSMNIFQNTNFKISNLRLAVLIKVVLIEKKCIQCTSRTLHKLLSCIIFIVFRCLDFLTFSVLLAFRASNAPIILKKLLGTKTIIQHSNESSSKQQHFNFFHSKNSNNYCIYCIKIKTNTIDTV